jgi:RNA polymerase sigma-70 factor (ECF subfamily)
LLHDRLCRFVQTIVWNNEDVKDVMSETWLKAFAKFESINQRDAFIYYLFSIASNLVKKQQRRNKFRAMFNWDHIVELSAWQHAESNIQRRELYNLLSKLNEDQREAITLFEVAGFSYAEIAKMKQCSVAAVKNRILRARQKLHGMVEREQRRFSFQIQGNKL